MANEKILILEAPWANKIDQTHATRDIYTSAETLLQVGPNPVRIIQRPLVSSCYKDDIKNFTELECNQRGPNFIVFSAHGTFDKVTRAPGKRVNRRTLVAFDGKINLSSGIRQVAESLKRTIIILDSCDVGTNIEAFYRASGAAGVIGFTKDVDWVDSTMFILAVLLKYHEEGVMSQERVRKATEITLQPRQKRVLEEMRDGPYKSLAASLGIASYFGP